MRASTPSNTADERVDAAAGRSSAAQCNLARKKAEQGAHGSLVDTNINAWCALQQANSTPLGRRRQGTGDARPRRPAGKQCRRTLLQRRLRTMTPPSVISSRHRFQGRPSDVYSIITVPTSCDQLRNRAEEAMTWISEPRYRQSPVPDARTGEPERRAVPAEKA